MKSAGHPYDIFTMEITGKIYARGLKSLRDNWPSAFLRARMSYSRGMTEKYFELLPLRKLKGEIIATLLRLKDEDFCLRKLPLGSGFEIIDLDSDVLVDEKVLSRAEYQGSVELSVRRKIDVHVKRVTLEITSGDEKRGIIFPIDFSSHLVRQGFRKEK